MIIYDINSSNEHPFLCVRDQRNLVSELLELQLFVLVVRDGRLVGLVDRAALVSHI